jgi:hypothetical protein
MPDTAQPSGAGAKFYKLILFVIFVLLVGLLFKLRPTGATGSTASDMERRYPSLYCRFHECSSCSADRIMVEDEVVFQLRPNCIQWFRTPYGRQYNSDGLDDLGYVIEYVDSGGYHVIPVIPHEPVSLGTSGCGGRGCELGVSGLGKFRVQLVK